MKIADHAKVLIQASDTEPGVIVLRLEGTDRWLSTTLRVDDGSALQFAQAMAAAYTMIFRDQIDRLPPAVRALIEPLIRPIDELANGAQQ